MQLDLESLREPVQPGAPPRRRSSPKSTTASARAAHDPIWISTVPREKALARARKLERDSLAAALPLYGVPFAIKDNIDLAGLPTTAGCPAYRLLARRAAPPVVQRAARRRRDPVGKTNMDQFATGLVGTRSPYGACSSVFDPRYISGGSSSGSAVAVRRAGQLLARHRHRGLGPRAGRVQRTSSG